MQLLKTIALIDPFWTGHHSTYIKLFTKAILSLDYTVMVFCPKPQEVMEWVAADCEHSKLKLHLFELHEPEPSRFPYEPVKRALNGFRMWRSAAKAIKSARRETGLCPDLVYFAYLDAYLDYYTTPRIVDLLFPYAWTGLFFSPWYLRQYEQESDIQGPPTEYDVELLARRCRGFGILDEGIAERMRKRFPGKQIVVFPDVADGSPSDRDFPLFREVVAKANGRKIVTLLGGVAKRKGILTLLEAATRMQSDECLFLVSGPLIEQAFEPGEVPTILRMAANPPQNCFFHFDFIPGETRFNALVELSDILFAGYENFPHSSNLLTKAALFEKPVIVSRGYLMEERVKAFGLGECIGEGDVSECIAAIRRLIHSNNSNRNFLGFRNLHSEEQFQSAVENILIAALKPR